MSARRKNAIRSAIRRLAVWLPAVAVLTHPPPWSESAPRLQCDTFWTRKSGVKESLREALEEGLGGDRREVTGSGGGREGLPVTGLPECRQTDRARVGERPRLSDRGSRIHAAAQRGASVWTSICSRDMLFCVRTTLNLDDELMKQVKRKAAETGRTMTEIIEEGLRESLRRARPPGAKSYRLKMVTVKGRLRPGVDLTDRDALYDLMEGRG